MQLDETITDVKAVIDRDGLDALIAALARAGYAVIGPKVDRGAIIYGPVAGINDLPVGWIDEQDAGTYRLERGAGNAVFAHVVGPHSWKRYLYPPAQKLWESNRTEQGFSVAPGAVPDQPCAFIGVRACELRAIAIQDKVFGIAPTETPATAPYADPGYAQRRSTSFIVAVNCTRAASTCFCVSMDSGPKVDAGFDLALTELIGDGRHDFLVEAGSERGRAVLSRLPHRPPEIADTKAAKAGVARAVAQNRRAMVPGVADLLKNNLESRHWEAIAKRCLSCANCTLVCPTCFCSTVEDTTDLAGNHAERWRKWDSCFTMDFSYIHGGSVRRDTASRYRQWMTHKLSNWVEQFGSSGCTGCGRCITWCPVGIDITEEARTIRDTQGKA